MAGLKVTIVTPEEQALDVACDELIVPGVNGEIGLLPQHVPLISALRPGVLTVIQGQKKSFYVIASGFVEVDQDRVSILTSSCEPATKVDVARARKSLGDSRKKLEALDPNEPGYGDAQSRVARALARLDGASRVDPSVHIE
jgi:F-type H+-transporting ATPase subunit epsilon